MRKISTPYGIRFIEENDVAGIHEFLLDAAADIANASPQLPQPFKDRGTRPFAQGDHLSGFEYLTLEIREGSLNGLTASEREPTVRLLHEIGTRAVHQAILENAEVFVGMIVGEARKGREYFERFEMTTDTE